MHDLAGHRIGSVFGVVHRRGGSTALSTFSTSKEKLSLFERSWDPAIDRFDLAGDPANVRRLARRLRGDPDTLSFLHLVLPDARLGRILRTVGGCRRGAAPWCC